MLPLPFKVRHNRIWAIFTLLMGLAALGFGLWIGEWSEIFMGSVLAIFGFLFLINPIMVLYKDEIQLRNMLGMTFRKIPYQPKNVHFEGFSLFVHGRKLPISAFSAHKADLLAIKNHLTTLNTERANS